VKRLFLVAGESSADLHAAALIEALRRLEPEISVAGLGGPRVEAAGGEVFRDVTAYAAVGFSEAIRNLRQLIGAFRLMVERMRQDPPDGIILLDYPDFNLRLAARARELGVPVIYYISPQVWAWRRGRVRKIRRHVDRMLVFFQFEKEFYARCGVEVDFVGHPLIDRLADRPRATGLEEELGLGEGPVIGLLPGSRRREVERIFPILLESAERIRAERPEAKFVVALAGSIPDELVAGWQERSPVPLHWVRDRTHDVMTICDLLLVASGTATLEAAILGTPMVVTYKVSLLTWLVFGHLLRVKHYAMVNIVAGEEVVPEFIQWKAKSGPIAQAALKLLQDDNQRTARQALAAVREKLGPPGASDRAARRILEILYG